MDDIFQILIWAFIIISFFASFFKKKEPPKQQPPRRYGSQDYNTPANNQSATSVDNEEYDILQEIENMFKTNTSQPTTLEKKEEQYSYNRPAESEHTRRPDEYTSYESTRRADEYTSYEKGRSPLETYKIDTSRSKGEEEFTSSEHSLGDYYRGRPVVKKAAEVDDSVSRQAEEFERFLKRKEKVNVMAATIRSRIKQPASFKEYIIMAEILGKPAFKTGGRAFRKTI